MEDRAPPRNFAAGTGTLIPRAIITVVAAGAFVTFTLPNWSDAAARGGGGGHGHFGSQMTGMHFGPGAHDIGRRDVGRHRFADRDHHERRAHRNDGKWEKVSAFRRDGSGPHADDGRWRGGASFGNAERRSRHVDGEWHTE